MAFTDRTAIVIGREGIERLQQARVAIYGLGGVGAACALDLVRAGVGTLHVIDFDVVEETNLNRLAFGYRRFLGLPKTEAFALAAREINPDVVIQSERLFFGGDDAARIIVQNCSMHADCIDSLNAKVNLIAALARQKLRFIASMGTAGRLQPERLRLGTMEEAQGCPLAKAVRQRLRRLGISLDFPVVWSDEPAVKPTIPIPVSSSAKATHVRETSEAATEQGAAPRGRQRLIQGSTPFVPQVAGHLMASWIVRQLLEDHAT